MTHPFLSHPWRWPLLGAPKPPPSTDSPGSFGAMRLHDRHTGIDLYTDPGTEVYACEPGVIVGIEKFTGPDAGSPWWHTTRALLIEGESGVILYGEIDPCRELCLRQRVARGTLLGTVLRVLKNDKGRPHTMLHLELYTPGTRESTWWMLGDSKPHTLLDPTELLAQSYQFALLTSSKS